MRPAIQWQFRAVHWTLLLLLLAVLGGCLPRASSDHEPLPAEPQDGYNTARLNCFLTLRDSEGPAIQMEIAAVEILADGLWLPLTRRSLLFDSAAIGDGQMLVAGRPMPPGTYQKLRLTVTQGALRQPDGKYAVIAPELFQVVIPIAEAISLGSDESRSIFLTWDVQNSLVADSTLSPVLEAAPPLRQLPVNLLYVACPEINTIFLVRADKDWVVDSFGLKGHPTYMARDPDPTRERLYVLAVRDRVVKVVGLSSQRVIDVFPIQLNDAPTFMTISSDGSRAYLLDARSGYVTSMDLASGRTVARVRLGYRPEYAVYLPDQNLLAVSLALSQTVVLLDPESLATLSSIPTGNVPQGLLVFDNRLYIAERGEHSVFAFDLASRAGLKRQVVGFGPGRLQASDSQIYVSNRDGGSLSVLMPDQLGVIREIEGFGRPTEMVFDLFYRRLYVADEQAGSLAVVDTNSNLLRGKIDLGAKPTDMALIQ